MVALKSIRKPESESVSHNLNVMPSKKPEKIRKVLPEGSIALSLLGNKNFTNNEVFLHRTYSANAQLHNGTFFTCLERYGGNSFERKNKI